MLVRFSDAKHNAFSEETQVELVNELCLVTLGRLPRETEWKVAKELYSAGSPKQATEDFFWTMLNSYDFLFIQ